jgi:hypothetical protein
MRFGRKQPTHKRITPAELKRVVQWAASSHLTVRMANVIIYLEYLKEIQALGLPGLRIRFESAMVGVCHNLNIVGFKCGSYGGERDVFRLKLQDRLDRPVRNAIIHASQALDQISCALEDDPTKQHRFKRARDSVGRC